MQGDKTSWVGVKTSEHSFSVDTHRYRKIEFLAVEFSSDDYKILDSFSTYERAFLCALGHALKRKLDFEDKVSDTGRIPANSLRDPGFDLSEERLECPASVKVEQKGESLLLKLSGQPNRLWVGSIVLLLTALSAVRVLSFMSGLGQAMTAACFGLFALLLGPFVWKESLAYRNRTLEIKGSELRYLEGKKGANSLSLSEIVQITVHKTGAFFFTENWALHLPCKDELVSKWLRSKIQEEIASSN